MTHNPTTGVRGKRCPEPAGCSARLPHREGRPPGHVRLLRVFPQRPQPGGPRERPLVRDADRLGLHGAAPAEVRSGGDYDTYPADKFGTGYSVGFGGVEPELGAVSG